MKKKQQEAVTLSALQRHHIYNGIERVRELPPAISTSDTNKHLRYLKGNVALTEIPLTILARKQWISGASR